MKKWLTAIFIIALISSPYIFIPNHIAISHEINTSTNSEQIKRCLHEKWLEFLQQNSSEKKNSEFFNGYNYTVTKVLSTGAKIKISKSNKDYTSEIFVLPFTSDSSQIQWSCGFDASFNPIKRIWEYLDAVNIKHNMTQLLLSLRDFSSKTEEVYGFHIIRTTIEDSFIVSTKILTLSSVDLDTIYALVNQIHQYIKTHGAIETNYPIVNVSNINNRVITMVGIATNTNLKDSGNIKLKALEQIPNKTLVMEVKGGALKISQAYKAMQNYMLDHNFTSPVIPFEMMITNREKEENSSKWKTRLYFPIV